MPYRAPSPRLSVFFSVLSVLCVICGPNPPCVRQGPICKQSPPATREAVLLNGFDVLEDRPCSVSTLSPSTRFASVLDFHRGFDCPGL